MKMYKYINLKRYTNRKQFALLIGYFLLSALIQHNKKLQKNIISNVRRNAMTIEHKIKSPDRHWRLFMGWRNAFENRVYHWLMTLT